MLAGGGGGGGVRWGGGDNKFEMKSSLSVMIISFLLQKQKLWYQPLKNQDCLETTKLTPTDSEATLVSAPECPRCMNLQKHWPVW